MPTVSWPTYYLPGSSPLILRALASPAMQPTQVRPVSSAALLCFDFPSPIFVYPVLPQCLTEPQNLRAGRKHGPRRNLFLADLGTRLTSSGLFLSHHKLGC